MIVSKSKNGDFNEQNNSKYYRKYNLHSKYRGQIVDVVILIYYTNGCNQCKKHDKQYYLC